MPTLKIAKDLFDLLYPVGTYYETSNSNWTPSASGWYGTWVEDTAGKTTVAKDASTFKTLGGSVGSESKSYTPSGTVQGHILTVNEIPSHQHDMNDDIYGGYLNRMGVRGDGGGSNHLVPQYTQTTSYSKYIPMPTGGGKAHNHGFTGNSSNINVIQPSVVVRRWHRTA